MMMMFGRTMTWHKIDTIVFEMVAAVLMDFSICH